MRSRTPTILTVSYFIGVDASEAYPRMFLTGDHNLGNGNPPATPYLFAPATGNPFASLGTNFPPGNNYIGWMDNQHSKQGNVGMADGSVECFSRSTLQGGLQNSGDSVHMAGNFISVCGGPAGMNRIQLP